MTHSPFLFFITLLAFFWAEMEIQIEGKNGWAANLPTWKIEKHPLLNWFYGGRPLTGYHVWAFLFVFSALHLPFAFELRWTWNNEFKIFGGYALFWVIEDFFWFVFNPHYGWKKFSAQHVWWHKRWLLGLPLDYWFLGTTAIVFIFLK